MIQITERFIAKAEAKFNSQQVDIREFGDLLSEWGQLISEKCYDCDSVKEIYLKLNHLKLTVKWFKEQCCSVENEQLQDFLQSLIQYIIIELESLSLYSETTEEIAEKTSDIQGTQNVVLSWTASKRSLLELVCALHEAKCINGGDITMTKVVVLFGQFFGIKLNNFNSELSKMADRKPQSNSFQRAYFMNELTDSFNKKMFQKQEKLPYLAGK